VRERDHEESLLVTRFECHRMIRGDDGARDRMEDTLLIAVRYEARVLRPSPIPAACPGVLRKMRHRIPLPICRAFSNQGEERAP